MNEMQQAFDIIRQQQAKLPEYSPAVMVGHQLMDLLKMQPEAAGFVLHDLQGKGMGIPSQANPLQSVARPHLLIILYHNPAKMQQTAGVFCRLWRETRPKAAPGGTQKPIRPALYFRP